MRYPCRNHLHNLSHPRYGRPSWEGRQHDEMVVLALAVEEVVDDLTVAMLGLLAGTMNYAYQAMMDIGHQYYQNTSCVWLATCLEQSDFWVMLRVLQHRSVHHLIRIQVPER